MKVNLFTRRILGPPKAKYYISVFICLALLSGCVSAAMQMYRPIGVESQYRIHGKSVGRFFKIFINDKEVITGSTRFFGGRTETAGSYETHAVNASCAYDMGFFINTLECIVFIDNERAATLTF